MQIKTIEQLPIFTLDLRFLKFFSYLVVHNWRRYVTLISYTSLALTLTVQLYFTNDSIDEIVRAAYIAVLMFNIIFRAAVLSINCFDYEKFMDNIRLMYIELMESDDKNIRKMLQEMANHSILVSKINLIIGTISLLGFLVYPLVLTTRALPYAIYVPGGIDIYQSPVYEICFIVEVLISPIGCFVYIPYTNLTVAFTLFAILMCKVLQYKLTNLRDVSNIKAREVIVWCVKYQLELIKCVDVINNLTTIPNMIEFLTFGAMLCAMLFSLVIAETFAQQFIIGFYMFMIFSNSVILYYFANVLYDQSLNVAVAAYECDWFEFDVATQKSVQLLMLRSQKPCAILVGKVYAMNLELLRSLLNVTYSYFTLLKRVYG